MKSPKLILIVFFICISLASTISMAQDRDSNSSVGEYVKDSVITSQIKAKLLAAEDLDSMGIKVDTDNNGKVVLSGKVKSSVESNRAHNIAHSVDGVKEVINRIETVNNY